MRGPRRPAGDLFTVADKRLSRRYGFAGLRERPIPTPKETEAQKAWVRQLRLTRLLRDDWRMFRPSGGDVPDEKWAGVQYAMGMDPGAADLLFVSGLTGHGHFMEWKRGPGEALRDEQEAMRRWALNTPGWTWETVWDATGAWTALQRWGALKREIKF